MVKLGNQRPDAVASAAEAGPDLALWATFLLAFALYAGTSSPALGWLDSPEFVAQAAELGVAHSPGHPLPALLGRLAGLFPIGDLVWRVNLMSALLAAGAVSVLFALLRRWFLQSSPPALRSRYTAIAAALALVVCACAALWSSAVRAEVYALQALLTASALAALFEHHHTRQRRWLMTTALFGGLALANHHLMALLLLLPAAAWVLARPRAQRPSAKTCAWTAAWGALGLFALSYLPLRSAAHPEVNFGAPHTLERFFWTLSGAAFSKSTTMDHVSEPAVDLSQVVVTSASAVTLPLFFLAIAGATIGLTRRGPRALTAFALAVFVLSALARVLLGFDPETPDHHAYLLPGIFALVLLAAVAVQHVAHRPSARRALAMVAIGTALLVPIQLAVHWAASNRQGEWSSDDMAHWELEPLPPRTIALLGYFETSFRIWALHAVEGARPDVAILDRSFLTYPGAAEEARLRYPELSTLIDAPLRAGAPLPIEGLTRLAESRPIQVQLHFNLQPEDRRWLIPSGPLAVFASSPPSPEHWPRLAARDRELRDQLRAHLRSQGSEEHDASKAQLWHDVTRLDQYCSLGDRSSAQAVLEDARALAPEDATLAALGQACGLQ